MGAILGGIFGGAAIWAFGLPPCVQGGYSCGGLENARTTAIGVLLGGACGAVGGVAAMLKVRGYKGIAATAGTLAVLIPVGIAGWMGALWWLSAVGLFAPPLLLPAVAALARRVVVRLGEDVGPAIGTAGGSLISGLIALILVAAFSGRHCPFHPPPSCSTEDLWIYAAWVAPTLYISAVITARARQEPDAAGVAGGVARLLPVTAAILVGASVLTHVLVGLFLMPFATSATVYVARRGAKGHTGLTPEGASEARS